MLVDSHCHIDDFPDLEEVLLRASNAGVGAILAIGIGEGPESMHRALELAHTHDGRNLRVFASAGIHPQEAHRADTASLSKLRTLAGHESCIAIGEIGLDYYHIDNPDPEIQQETFVAQMRIAAAVEKPITIHCRTSELASDKVKLRFCDRDAAAELLELVAEHWLPTGLPGIMHCFSGDQPMAERSVELGFYLSFAGNLTYPKSAALQEIAQNAPANRLLVETDAPFLTPQSRRGTSNEPAFVAETAAYLASLRGVSADDIARQTTANFHRLFPSTQTDQLAAQDARAILQESL